MKKVRRILCGALAALLLAGCGSGTAGEYAIVETSYPARTQKTEERVDTEELVRFSSETAEVILPAGENAVYAPVSLYLSLGMLTELTEGRTKEQVTELLGVSDSETLRQWTQSLWRQLYCDEKDSALWLGTAAFLNEAMTFHKEPLEVLAEDYYASSYGLPMGTSGADKAIAAWLDRQTNDLLTDDTGAIRTEKRDLLRLYNTIYYKAAWQAEFFGGATAEDIFTAADGTELTISQNGSQAIVYAYLDGSYITMTMEINSCRSPGVRETDFSLDEETVNYAADFINYKNIGK